VPRAVVDDHRKSSPVGRTGSGGFSLVELMVVLVIIGMMATVATISWQYVLPNQRFNTGIRNLSKHLADTRSKAIAFSRKFEFHYHIDENRYWVETPYRPEGGFAISDDEPRRDIYITNLEDKYGIEIVSVTIDDRVFTDGEVEVHFDPLGAGAGHRIVLNRNINENDNLYTLEVFPLTGEIRLHEDELRPRIAAESDFD